MYSGKDAVNPGYPTQWALNPSAYQNVDSSQVDWAALAQQWIAMKEAAAMVTAPPPPSKADAEEGEAPMEVENSENAVDSSDMSAGPEWNAAATTNSWNENWNQWGWGWPAGTVDPKMSSDPSMAMAPIVDGYAIPSDSATTIPGYTTGTVPAPTFQHGYWTAAQADQQTSSRSSSGSRSRTRRSKSKNRESKSSRTSSRTYRDKPTLLPPLIETVAPAGDVTASSSIDAAKRRQLPAWIREGLEKMEREKQRAIEKEQEKKAKEEAEKERKRLEEEELLRMKAEASGVPMMPAKSKFETDSESEEMEDVSRNDFESRKEESPIESEVNIREQSEERQEPPPLVKKSKEEIMQEVMLAVRRSLTEILFEVTDREIQMVSQEEMARYNAQQASSLNAIKASKSKALASIASGLGLGAYESSSDEDSDQNDHYDISDQQLQDLIKRKRMEFERTSREIEAEVRRAELRENEPATPPTPRQRNSTTPPPVESETPEKIPDRRPSTEKKNSKSNDRVDGVRRLDTIYEDKVKKSSKHDRTPSPPKLKSNHKSTTPSSTSDSEQDSESESSKSSEEIRESKSDKRAKKRKRSSSDESRKKSRKEKSKKSHKEEKSSKSKYDDYEVSSSKSRRKKDDYDRHKSRSSKDRHKSKYRDESDDDKPKKKSKRSRSTSYESRSARKRSHDRSEERSRRRDKRSYDRDRSYDRSYDKYERTRDDHRSHSRSRHRR